ncbi:MULTISPECIES: hypothetical protein [unclassified Tolypothrix]|nr:hypothetical protein [Tolypothrix sp. LEGE 11397]UYD26680.1 hypothetical protein HGR01_00725 [Tolypothrix sp. PCC 7712]UYD37459.1 hypothetical protein HG267_18080 [Tolypothrix sp. PCC 7601]
MQSYDSRYVRPPIIYSDVVRTTPMTLLKLVLPKRIIGVLPYTLVAID